MKKGEKLKDKLHKCRQETCHQHEKFFRLHKEYDEEKRKLELHRMHRHTKVSPPIILAANVLIWYLVFRYAGIKEVSIFFAVLFTVGGIFEFLFLRKLEKRLLAPLDKLKEGIEEVTRGNYQVIVESSSYNQISLLADAFNEMAQKLGESERIKLEYEENRKALIANISHDLKTPITSIQGYIEAITEGNVKSPEEVEKYLKIIHNNAAYMNKLIEDLFFFSKLDMQKLEFEFVRVNVRHFVQDLMEEFALELEERNINFHYSEEVNGEGYFNIDRKRLYQVFRNIIGNAEKHGSSQGLIIKVTLSFIEPFAVIAISDNGLGIPEDKLPHIFERFYRIDSERTKDLMSTGLGLAIAKELIEAHGGKISVSSTPGKGSCFTVMLPMIQENSVEKGLLDEENFNYRR